MTLSSSRERAPRLTVLLVEDHWLLLDELTRLLEEAGYDVLRAGHGEGALAMLESRSVDLIVSDWHMPRGSVDGLELLRRLRKQGDETWFLLISVRGEVADRVTGLDAGADDYLVKPFEPEELLARLAVGARQTHRRRHQGKAASLLRGTLADATRAQRDLLPPVANDLSDIRYAYWFAPVDIGFPRSPADSGILFPNVSADDTRGGPQRSGWGAEPSKFVGGDGLNVVKIDPGHVMFYLFDVSGHGVPAVMLATSLQKILSSPRLLQSLVGLEPLSPLAVVRSLNQEFPFSETGRTITMFLGLIERRTGHLRYVRAGHPAPYLIRPGQPLRTLEGCGVLLGLDSQLTNLGWTEQTIQLHPGDGVVVYAVLDSRDFRPEDVLVSSLQRQDTTEPDAVLTSVKQALQSQCPTLQDDLSLLAIQYLG